MTNWLSRWRKGGRYQSLLWLESDSFPGVRFSIRKMSLAQRIDLSGRIRHLTLNHEFLKAGEVTDQLEAGIADLLVQKLYLEWGICDITGLTIDGKAISVPLLIERGPEALVTEITSAIHASVNLSDDERKNF